jgi:hypothetical protein
MEVRDPIRFWGGAVGAVALGLAIIVAVVLMQKPKSDMAGKTQPVAKVQTAAKAQMVAKAVGKAPMAVNPLTPKERKISEELWIEQRKVDSDTRAMAATTEGRRRIAETIAKQMDVTDKLVMDLRGRKLGYGEITVALAVARQVMKREKLTQQQALDRVLRPRRAGQGWGVIARDFGLDMDDVVSDVKKTDKRLAKLEPGKR